MCLSLKNECEVELSVHRHMICSSALPWIVVEYCTVVCMGGWLLGCICPCFFFVLNHPVSFLVYPEVSLALVLSRKNGCQVVMPIHFRLEYVCVQSVSINCFSTHGIQSRRGQLGFMACIYLFIRNCQNRSKYLSAKAGTDTCVRGCRGGKGVLWDGVYLYRIC